MVLSEGLQRYKQLFQSEEGALEEEGDGMFYGFYFFDRPAPRVAPVKFPIDLKNGYCWEKVKIWSSLDKFDKSIPAFGSVSFDILRSTGNLSNG